MNFNNKLLSDIESYCILNDLDVDEFANNLLKKAFMVEKYGEKPPFMMKKEEPTVEVGEKQEEKPVEVVEIVNEVPEEPVVEEKVTEINEDQEANEFKLVEKKVKKPRKRKLA